MSFFTNKNCVKTPVILQMEIVECGAACLAMIMAHYKKWVPLEQVRVDSGVSRDGSNAASMLKAARNYGFETSGFRYSVESLQSKVAFPCIIHWEFNHFVVLNGFQGKYASINDPARGTVKVPLAEFRKSYTGICLMMTPGENFEPGGKRASVWNFTYSRLKSSIPLIILLMIASLLAALLGILSPIFSRVFTDYILVPGATEWIAPLMAAMATLAVYSIIVLSLREYFAYKVKGKLAIVSNVDFLWHTLRLPVEFFAQRMVGDIVQRQSSNDEIAETLISKLTPVLLNFVLLIFYLIIMINYSLWLTLVGVLIMLVNLVLVYYVNRQRVNLGRVQMRDEGKLYGVTVSGISMIETVKSAGAEDGFFARWAGLSATLNKAIVKANYLEQIIGNVPAFLQQLSAIIILAMGAWLTMQGEFTAGMLIAFQAFMVQFLQPVNALIDTGQSVQEMRSSMERIEDVMKYEVDVPEELVFDALPEAGLQKLSGQIELSNISFGYSKLAEPMITDFSMTLKQGAKVAFVGASGCGKSTLVKLISGLYEPWQGKIKFDGKQRKDIPRSIFTASVAVVDQDITLFDDTITQNIKMWDSTIEDFEVILAARDVQIHDEIVHRDGGYNAPILEQGKNFSGGQRQRLEIARVLAQDPTIVILDEATSSLDAKTEHQVISAIKDRNITCIVVAHRLSTIRDCDEIIVMDKGLVVQRGTHEQLLAKGGLYTELITTE